MIQDGLAQPKLQMESSQLLVPASGFNLAVKNLRVRWPFDLQNSNKAPFCT